MSAGKCSAPNGTYNSDIPKVTLFCIWPKFPITNNPVDHKQYTNDVALRTDLYL